MYEAAPITTPGSVGALWGYGNKEGLCEVYNLAEGLSGCISEYTGESGAGAETIRKCLAQTKCLINICWRRNDWLHRKDDISARLTTAGRIFDMWKWKIRVNCKRAR